jgi:putative transcription factor
MMLCPQCGRHGEGRQPTNVSAPIRRFIQKRVKRAQPKDIYQKMKKELISNYNEEIKTARKKKGLTREDLGFKIGERTVTISKIENGDLRPSDKTITKLEKELGITLLEEVKTITPGHTKTESGMTLGDFIKTED